MPKILFFVLLPFLLKACEPKKMINCKETNMSGFSYMGKSKTIIPLDSRNFWMYDDSIRNHTTQEMQLRTSNFLLYIDYFSQINDNNSIIYFNKLFAPFTTLGDDILYAEPTQDCYKFHPYLPKPQDTLYLNSEKNIKIYPKNGQIQTKLGSISYNYVKNEANGYYMYFNDNIGLIRKEIIVNGIIQNSLTINNYEVIK